MIPGSPIAALIGHQAVGAEQIEAISSDLGLDKSLIDQYLEWLPAVLTGDFGTSLFYEDSVVQVVMDRFPVTLYLTVFSMILTILVGIPLGIYASIRRGRVADYASNVFLESRYGHAVILVRVLVDYSVCRDARLASGIWIPKSGFRYLGVAKKAHSSRFSTKSSPDRTCSANDEGVHDRCARSGVYHYGAGQRIARVACRAKTRA